MKNPKYTKKIKKIFYKARVKKFKNLVIIMVITGFVFSTFYVGMIVYGEYASSQVGIALTFPEIAQSRYPDESRFTYYDFISDKNLKEALNIMKAKGKYENFTVADIRDNFYIYTYLKGSAGASVSAARSEGNDYSYVANEYKITFIQPHDYKNKNILARFFGKDYSSDFLEALIQVNNKRIREDLGGVNSFRNLTTIVDEGNYDYSEEIGIYKTRINTIISHLKYIGKKEPGFVDKKYNLSLSDLESKYSFLITNNLDGISDFIESSGISKDAEVAKNKVKVNLENMILKYNKAADESKINRYAMENYDQTFTENLINVVRNEEYGLYQARPKTAFDTVVAQKHDAEERVAEYNSKKNQYNSELTMFDTVVQTPEEHDRLVNKCEELMEEFKQEYDELSEIGCEIIAEYYNEINEHFISTKIEKRQIISKQLLVKAAIVFAFGALVSFVVTVFLASVMDSRKLKRKKLQLQSMKKLTKEKGA